MTSSAPPRASLSARDARWPLWTAPAGLLLGFMFGSLGTIVVDVVAGATNVSHPGPAASIIGDIVFDLGFVAAALWLASWRERAPATAFGFRAAPLRRALVALLGAAAAYYLVTAVYSSALGLHGQDKLPSELGVTHSTAALLAASIFVCVIAPIAEEFFFRGFLFGALRRLPVRVAGHDLGPWAAAIIVGILFGLAHTGSASSQYLVPLGFLGFVLCLLRWRTGSLYPCMALHSANNALALGVNQLGATLPEIIGLVLGAWLTIGLITGPLAWRDRRARGNRLADG